MNDHSKLSDIKEQNHKQLELMSEEWWGMVQKIPANDIGGYYWKVWVFIPYLAVGATDKFDAESLDLIKADLRRIEAKLGRKTTVLEALDRLSSTTPLLVVDRYKSRVGRLMRLITMGRYKRYACLNPFQAVFRDRLSDCVTGNPSNNYIVHAVVADQPSITKQYLRELEQNMKSYKREGAIDAQN